MAIFDRYAQKPGGMGFKRYAPTSAEDGLDFLVRFLNSDFESLDSDFWEGGKEGREQVRLFRERLLGEEILPLVATEPYEVLWNYGKITIAEASDWRKMADPGDAWRCLLRDIEEAGLKFTLLRLPGEATLIRQHYDPVTGSKGRKEEIPNEHLFSLGRGQGVVDLPSGKFIFRRRFIDLKTIEQRIYACLIRCLETGEFENLRFCSMCKQFFVKGHGNQLYCDACSRAAERRANRIRATNFRKRQKRRLALARRKPAPAAPAVYLQSLIDAEKYDRTGRLLHIYKRLGGPQDGRKFIRKLQTKHWNTLDESTRSKILKIQEDYPSLTLD